MRLISQNGMIDIPYELVTVFRDYKLIYARFLGTQNQDTSNYEMAYYSTEEKARKVMELLKREFIEYGISGYFIFPQDKEV